MTVCLQGGAEFGPGCREMDAAVLAAAGPGPVVVSALAGAVGADYATATAHGVRHHRALAADGVEVLAAPDAREDPDGAERALRSAGLLVLPGGSPWRLLAALRSTPAGDAVLAVLEAGGAVSGSSAGAMVLCGWTVLPDAPDGLRVEPGLGVVPGALVLPHWRGDRPDWLRAVAPAVPEGTRLLGLAEESGVLLSGGTATALGQRAAQVLEVRAGEVQAEGSLAVGERCPAVDVGGRAPGRARGEEQG